MNPALLLGAGVVAALLALKLITSLLVRGRSETLEFRGRIHAVAITIDKGEVIVRGDEVRRTARVRRRLHHGPRAPRISEQVDDGVLRLEVTAGIVQYEVDVPAGASVLVQGRRASATVVGISGPVELRTGAGSLEGRALSAGHVSATTTSGSIRLSFDSQPEVVDVTTREGAVELALPGGPYDVDADAADARVDVRCAEGARRRVRARAGHGPVRIRDR